MKKGKVPLMSDATRSRLEKYFFEETDLFLNKTRLCDDSEIALKNVCHAVMWACSLDEYYQKAYSSGYESFRKTDSSSDSVLGIRYARNRSIHQFTQVLNISDGMQFPGTFPITFFEIKWKPISELPPPDKKHPQEKLRHAYEVVLESQPIRQAFEVMKMYFERARNAFP